MLTWFGCTERQTTNTPARPHPRADNGESHIAKTGLFSSIKSAAKKVGGAIKRAAKVVGRAAVKYVPKFPPVAGVINAGKALKALVKGKFRRP